VEVYNTERSCKVGDKKFCVINCLSYIKSAVVLLFLIAVAVGAVIPLSCNANHLDCSWLHWCLEPSLCYKRKKGAGMKKGYGEAA